MTTIPTIPLQDALEAIIRPAIEQCLRDVLAGTLQKDALLSPEELAKRLNVPVSWVYEQNRLGKLPVHRFGRYIRFDFDEVLASRKDPS